MEMLWLLAGSTSIQITWNLGLSRPFCRAWITTLVPSCIRLHCLRDASMNSDLNWLEVFSRLDQLDLHDEHFLSKALVLLHADYPALEMLFGGANILNVTAVTMTCKGPNLSCIKHKVFGLQDDGKDGGSNHHPVGANCIIADGFRQVSFVCAWQIIGYTLKANFWPSLSIKARRKGLFLTLTMPKKSLTAAATVCKYWLPTSHARDAVRVTDAVSGKCSIRCTQ